MKKRGEMSPVPTKIANKCKVGDFETSEQMVLLTPVEIRNILSKLI